MNSILIPMPRNSHADDCTYTESAANSPIVLTNLLRYVLCACLRLTTRATGKDGTERVPREAGRIR